MIDILRPTLNKAFVVLWLSSLGCWLIWSYHLFSQPIDCKVCTNDIAIAFLSIIDFLNSFKGHEGLPNYTLK